MDETSEIMKRFLTFFYSPGSPRNSKILVASKYTERTRINLCLLKFFLQEMKQRGIFITIDRPHQYTASLLATHNIPQDNLIYIDAISRLSGEKESNVSNVKFINGPYELNFLEEVSSISFASGAVNSRSINLDELDFILVDDIAALTKYQEEDGVQRMIDSYISSIERIKSVTAPIVLDVNKDKYIYELLVAKCDRILLVNLSSSVVKELPHVDKATTIRATGTDSIHGIAVPGGP